MSAPDAIGEPAALTTANVAAALWLGSLGVLILGVQPVVLEPLVRFGRLGEASLGAVATAEILAIAVGSILGARALASMTSRTVAVTGLLLFVVANLAMHWLTGWVPLLSVRALSGLAGGTLVGLAIVSIARGKRPERLSAAFLVAQTLLQLCVAALIPFAARHLLAADFGFVALAMLGVASVPVLVALPPRLMPPRTSANSPAPVGREAWAALTACGAYLLAVVAVWAYFGVWEHQLGLSEQVVGATAALSLAAQVMGAAAAGWLGPLLSSRPVLLLTTAAQSAVVLGLLQWRAPAAQVALALAFGFLWLFAMPMQTRFLIDVDPTRRAVLHLAAAQLTGSAAGPTLAGLFVTTGRTEGALWTGITALAASALLVVLAARPADVR